MKIVFNISVGIEVPSYVQAGEVLDRITRDLDQAVGPKGSYDVSEFRARHRPVDIANAGMERGMAREYESPD